MATTALWGSSFPAIKVVVPEIGDIGYTWMRGALAVLALAPYIIYVAARGKA